MSTGIAVQVGILVGIIGILYVGFEVRTRLDKIAELLERDRK